jgi:UDP-glucose 4-epimerase
MRALVTGANGFLGRYVVAALLRSGHRVRALLGPRASARDLAPDAAVESLRADLLGAKPLEPAFEGVDVLVHLAAKVLGDDRERIAVAVDGTERLLAAMVRTPTRRLVLASSFAVYDWERVGSTLTEASPLRAPDAPGCEGYARAKRLQEEVARRFAEREGWGLSILRPSSLWGAGRLDEGDVGRRVGPVIFVVGPRRRLRLCYVENAADAFARAAELSGAGVRVFNVVDRDEVRAWRYARECLSLGSAASLRLPVPYRPALACLRGAEAALHQLTRGHRRLPGILAVTRFEAQFRPVECSAEAARRLLGWVPRVDYAEALERTRAVLHAAPGSGGSSREPERVIR